MMGVGVLDFIDYASTTKNKTIKIFTGYETNGTITDRVSLESASWMSTAAMTSFTINTNGNGFTTSTTFSLYGIKGE